MDADRLLVTGLTILALLLWVPARLLGDLGLSWLPEAALQVKGKIVHCSKWIGFWKDNEGIGLAMETAEATGRMC